MIILPHTAAAAAAAKWGAFLCPRSHAGIKGQTDEAILLSAGHKGLISVCGRFDRRQIAVR